MSIRVKIYLAVLFVISFLGGMLYKKLTAPFKILVLLITCTFVSECISRYLAVTIHNSNPPYHFFCILEYICFASIYLRVFNDKIIKSVIRFSIPIVMVLSIINSFFLQKIMTFPSNILLVSYTCIVIMSLFFFRQMLNYPLQINIFYQDLFWFNSIVLLFGASVFFTLGFYNYLLRHNIDTHFISTINYVINILFYLVLGGSILLNASRLKRL